MPRGSIDTANTATMTDAAMRMTRFIGSTVYTLFFARACRRPKYPARRVSPRTAMSSGPDFVRCPGFLSPMTGGKDATVERLTDDENDAGI